MKRYGAVAYRPWKGGKGRKHLRVSVAISREGNAYAANACSGSTGRSRTCATDQADSPTRAAAKALIALGERMKRRV